MSTLTYEKYSNKRLAVRGDRNRYSDILKGIGGRWNPRMRGGAGWLLPEDKEESHDYPGPAVPFPEEFQPAVTAVAVLRTVFSH